MQISGGGATQDSDNREKIAIYLCKRYKEACRSCDGPLTFKNNHIKN